jgi:hypothetical protein
MGQRAISAIMEGDCATGNYTLMGKVSVDVFAEWMIQRGLSFTPMLPYWGFTQLSDIDGK